MNILAYVHLRNIYGSTGAGRVARNITEALHARGEDTVHVLADQGDRVRLVEKVGEPWTNFDYHCFQAKTSVQQRRWVLFNRPYAESFWPEAEVVYCTGEAYVPTRKARIVNLMHDAAFFDCGAHQFTLRYLYQQAKWRILFARISATADLIHTVSNFSAERLTHHFPSLRDRFVVVHNAVTDVFFEDDCLGDHARLDELGLAQVPFILLPRGLAYRKNADLVLSAWPRLRQMHPDLCLVVTSHNDPNYVGRALAQEGIVTTGFVPDETLRALYTAARLVWFPSRYEGFGIPALEGMACGAPVVASNAASLPEIVGDAAVLVPPSDEAGHIEAIDYLLHNDAARDALARKGRAHAARFTWANAAAKLRAAMVTLA